MARTVEDLVLTLPLIMGADWRDPLTVSGSFQNPITVDLRKISAAFYVDNGIIPPTAETAEAVKKAARVLAEAGVAIQEARPLGISQTHELFSSLMGADRGAELNDTLQLAGTKEMCSRLKRARRHCVGGRFPVQISPVCCRGWTHFGVQRFLFSRNSTPLSVLLTPSLLCRTIRPMMTTGFTASAMPRLIT